MTKYDLALNSFSAVVFRPRRGRIENVFWFLISTGIMCWTLNLALIATWLFIWGFAHYYNTKTEGNEFLMFFVGFYLFYPALSTVFHDIHEQAVVLTVILIIFFLRYRSSCFRALFASKALGFVFYGWILWGLIAYFPVLYINVIDKFVFQKLFEESSGLFGFDRGSTVLKTALPMIVSPVVLLIPILGLRRESDLESFWAAIINGTLILCVLSLIRYIFYFDFIPQEYADIHSHGFRMTGFSMPDPNGFARMLLLPIVLISALAIQSPGRLGINGWITLALGLTCVILSYSRMSYLSLIFSLGSLLIFNMRKKRTLLFLILSGVVVGSVLNFFDILSYFEPGADRASMVNFQIRLLIMDKTLRIISENPLFGAWPGGYSEAMFGQGYSGFLSVTDGRSVPSTHNMVLNVAVEWGIPMAFLLLVALILSFVYGMRAIRQGGKGDYLTQGLVYGTTALCIGMFVHGITEIVGPYLVFFNLGLIFSLSRYRILRGAAEHSGQRFFKQNWKAV